MKNFLVVYLNSGMVSARAFNGPIIHFPLLLFLLLGEFHLSPVLAVSWVGPVNYGYTGNWVYLLLFIAKIHLFYPLTSPAEEMVYIKNTFIFI